MGFIGGGKSRPPSESKRQPSGLRFEASTWKNRLASPKGDLQICSEVGNSRGRVLVPDCPLTRLPRPWDSPGKSTGVGCHCLLQDSI